MLNKISNTFGEQCIVGSLDYSKQDTKFSFFKNNGSILINQNIKNIFKKISKLPIGEVILNSIDMDGTGNGFDFKIFPFLVGILKNLSFILEFLVIINIWLKALESKY